MSESLRSSARTGAAIVAAAFFALPLLYLASVSFKTVDDVLVGDFLPNRPTLANWSTAFAVAPLTAYIRNSVLASIAAGFVTIAIAIPAAYGMIRREVGRRWLPNLTLSSYIAPPVVLLLPLFYLLKAVALINTLPGLALVYGFLNVPVAFWLLAPFFRHLPDDIEAAAELDGAGPLRVLLTIVCPLIAPGIAATAIIATVLAYNEFLLGSMLTFNEVARTLPVGLSLFQGDRIVNFGQIAVASLSGVAPVYVLAFFAQRWLIEGLSHGSGR